MLNSQLLNNLSDFFTAFKELSDLAKTDNLETVVAGLSEAKATLARHAGAKKELIELEDFKATKKRQLSEIADAKTAAAEAAKLNAKQAKALKEAATDLETEKTNHAKQVKADADKAVGVEAREDAVAVAEQRVKDSQAEADQLTKDAAALKNSYITKLKTLAQTEGAPDVSSSS